MLEGGGPAAAAATAESTAAASLECGLEAAGGKGEVYQRRGSQFPLYTKV